MPTSKKNALGFTLIEILIVIMLIGILSVIGVYGFTSSQQRVRDATRKADLKNLQTALRLYYNDRGRYPASSGGQINACGSSCNSPCNWGSEWLCGSTSYMSTLPKDPVSQSADGYVYVYTVNASDSDLYTLSTCLENKNDSHGIVDTGCNSGLKFEVKP